MVLPGDLANETRLKFADIIRRYMAGDAKLTQQVRVNAQSDNPILKLARESLEKEEQEKENKTISINRKRTLENLEIEERMVIMERSRAETERMKAETERSKTETKTQELEKQLEIFTKANELYIKLSSPQTSMDERARLIFKDNLMNMIVKGVQPPVPVITMPAIAGDASSGTPTPTAPSVGFLTISALASEMGYKFDSSQLKKLGMRIAQAYSRQYKQSPPKHDQFVDGAVRKVNSYHVKDRALLEREITGFTSQT